MEWANNVVSSSIADMAKPLLDDLLRLEDMVKTIWKSTLTHNRCVDGYDYLDLVKSEILQFKEELEHELKFRKLRHYVFNKILNIYS